MNTPNPTITSVLKIDGVPEPKQAEILARVEKLIQEKVRLAILEKLIPEQLKTLAELENASDEDINTKLAEMIPNFNEVVSLNAKSVVDSLTS